MPSLNVILQLGKLDISASGIRIDRFTFWVVSYNQVTLVVTFPSLYLINPLRSSDAYMRR